jgi:hypothetical protein
VPTLVSSLLFAGSRALTLHYLEAATYLGMAPAGQALLSQSARDIGRRSALRSLVLQSTNEMLEGLWRGLALAGYAGARGIGLRCTNINAGLTDVPAAVRASRGDPATWNRTAVFASARMLDGALPNLLAQLASTPGTTPYWNGFRIGAVLAQGATMARTPVIAAYVLPRMSVDSSLAPAGTGGSHTEPTEPTNSSAASPSASEAAADGSTQTSIVVDSVDATEDTSSSLPTPCADPNLAWA